MRENTISKDDTAGLWQCDEAGAVSEDACLAVIDACFPARSPHVPLGRGDDCAELADLPGRLALSTDMFLEDVHFRRSYFSPQEVGAKALNRALSDLAAAGAVPLGFSLDLLLPPSIGSGILRAILDGMAKAAERLGVFLAGGDLARSERLGFGLTVWGRPPDSGARLLHRRKAAPGDSIFLLGEAGLARAGLMALEREGRPAVERWPLSCAAHLAPKPLIKEGQSFARIAHSIQEKQQWQQKDGAGNFSMMDISDGLARDLPRLLGPYGANLELEADAIPNEVRKAAAQAGMSAEDFFLLGGEDYCLVGTCPEEHWLYLQTSLPGARRIGRVAQERGLCLSGRRLELQGFDHFTAPPAAAADRGNREEAARFMARLGREAWQAGLMAGFNGNISCRSSDGQCCITGTGSAKARLREEDCVLISLPEGNVLEAAPLVKPSSESPLHLAVYAACPQSNVILHVHPPHLLALSLLVKREEFLALPLPEAERYRALLAHVPFMEPGSGELAEEAGRMARKHPALWLERHGLVVHGKEPHEVLALAEELEQLAKMQLAVLRARGA